MIGTLVACIFVSITSWLLAYRCGFHKGVLRAAYGRQKYLAVRIAGAQKGVTTLDPRDFEGHTIAEAAKHCPSITPAWGTPNWFAYCVANYGGEAGEFQSHIAKAIRDDGWTYDKTPAALTPERRMSLLKELGDELWYIVWLARELKSSLHEVMLLNIEKIAGRHARKTISGSGDNR